MSRKVILTLALGLLAIGLVACGEEGFDEPVVLGGQEVSADVLNLGKETYVLYCRACHGMNGEPSTPAGHNARFVIMKRGLNCNAA